jgi:hypothetical protein
MEDGNDRRRRWSSRPRRRRGRRRLYSKKGSVDKMCDGKSCYPEAKDDYNTANNWANGATVVSVAGTALLVTGLFLIPSSEPDQASAVPTVRVGAGSMTGTWRFW